MLNLKSLTAGVHNNSVAHGWWEEERNFGELIALCHSELSEALEEYRNGKMLNETYYSGKNKYGQLMQSHEKTENCKKPEGIPSELADVVIRVLDMCGRYHFDIPEDDSMEGFLGATYAYDKTPFAEFICGCHSGLSAAAADGIEHLEVVIIMIFSYCKVHKIDIEAAILEKHEFNKTRPYKHGGKVI